jgi:hypothetical protein
MIPDGTLPNPVYDTCDEADTNPLGLFEIVAKSTCAEEDTRVGLPETFTNVTAFATFDICDTLALGTTPVICEAFICAELETISDGTPLMLLKLICDEPDTSDGTLVIDVNGMLLAVLEISAWEAVIAYDALLLEEATNEFCANTAYDAVVEKLAVVGTFKAKLAVAANEAVKALTALLACIEYDDVTGTFNAYEAVAAMLALGTTPLICEALICAELEIIPDGTFDKSLYKT